MGNYERFKVRIADRDEDAISLPLNGVVLRFVETEDGSLVRMLPFETEEDPGTREFELDAEQTAALGRFCLEMFCDPYENLQAIEESYKFALDKLEDWNIRARADEEHPPYDDICNRLRMIGRALGALQRVLRKE